MKISIIYLLFFLFLSCSSPKLINYSVYSEEGEFQVLYSNNIEEIAEYEWSKNIISCDVFIYVIPKAQNQKLDVRVMYIDDGPLRLYKREVGEGPILIKGKL